MKLNIVVKLVLFDRMSEEDYLEGRRKEEKEAYIVPISTAHFESTISGYTGWLRVSITDNVGKAMTA